MTQSDFQTDMTSIFNMRKVKNSIFIPLNVCLLFLYHLHLCSQVNHPRYLSHWFLFNLVLRLPDIVKHFLYLQLIQKLNLSPRHQKRLWMRKLHLLLLAGSSGSGGSGGYPHLEIVCSALIQNSSGDGKHSEKKNQ